MHWVQLLHSDISQFTGQACVLQLSVSTSVAGHGAPPLAGCVMTVLVLVRVPPPQVAEHSDHALQLDVSQFTGHGCVLQL